ncbi:YHS domain-containing (seleno)protein [Flavivirga spongiicola]|uniref:YHS domain protein n=1 Tax=Flavivirga spongiicola TaxID=421621 RepID=A0ABU7XUB4_9FLAO|nr:YHS domain-containing (seleno)protein [Flavivirga sp. MEBiC05379]MDO5979349.1 YHS domain-containing (seleno)protein [Flavivirga sp. MEBiC05379]
MKKRTKIILVLFVVIITLVFTVAKVKRISPLSWGDKGVNKPMFSNQAINGYDAVTYFIENKAVLGNETYSYNWKNADWNFSSEENKNLFIGNPGKYAPQYGGYCAFAVSKGFTANTNPNSFEVIDGKLYLFDGEGVKADWKENLKENLQKCETNWKKY